MKPPAKHLVLLGGGHTHVEVLRRLGLDPPENVRVTLIGRERFTPYSGMLPGHIAGHYRFDQMHIDLEPLAKFAGATYIQDEAVGVDLQTRRVLCHQSEAVPFDLLSINTGITPAISGIAGAREHAIAVKPIGKFLERWTQLRERVEASSGTVRIGVIGGGAGGVELLLALEHTLGKSAAVRAGKVQLEFHLVSAGEILATHSSGVRRRFLRVLRQRKINVIAGSAVTAIDAQGITLANGARQQRLALDAVLLVTAGAAPAWLRDAGFQVNDQGFIQVADTLESLSHPGIFAAGDVAAVVKHPREKAGVFAVRQGPPLTENLHRALHGEALRPFTPQKIFLSLITTGDRYAIASYGRWSAEGRWVWRWKDWIDRHFMARYHTLSGA